MKQITNSCLRYLYPFYFEETLDRAAPKIDRYEKPNGDTPWKYERVVFSEEFHEEDGVFPFLADSFYTETGDKAGVGRCWKMTETPNRAFLSTRFSEKSGEEELEVTVGITKIGLLLTRMHTGFLWMELELTAERITSKILLDFQKNLMKANPFAEWIAEWLSPLSCRFIPERRKGEKSLPIRPFCFAACVAEESTEKERQKLETELGTDGVAWVYAKAEDMPIELRRTYFFLTLRALYRQYAALYFVGRIRRTVSAAREDYDTIREKDLQKLEQKQKRREKLTENLKKLITELTVYLAVNADGPVSIYERHNTFERNLFERLDVWLMEMSLKQSKEFISELLNGLLAETEQEEKEKKAAEKAELEAARREEEEQRQGSFFSRKGRR